MFNERTLIVEESIHVLFDDANSSLRKENVVDDEIDILQEKVEELELDNENKEDEDQAQELDEQPNDTTKEKEPTHPRGMGRVKPTVGTKWVFKNKMDGDGDIIRNKARLVAKGYSQKEGIDFDETYALVVGLDAIRMLLSFACYINFKLF
ncbi:Uncharacterized protein TCM_023856 [Theobroma cacao]|uniref:Reverse transcriptase Ty1/copia-type domain-containing protein n=1 Tax=Theobroma cacao TaxID=3641 RepID=A0A061EWG4_THECC|nr:Uncharacterized protein TCM_023856 [Theobroma cacao]